MTDTLGVEQLLNLMPEAHAWTLTSAARAELPDGHRLRVEGTRVRHYSALSTALGLYEYRPARRLLETSAADPAGDRFIELHRDKRGLAEGMLESDGQAAPLDAAALAALLED